MSTITKVTCDRCGAEHATIGLLISDGDPRVSGTAIISDLHACTACVAAIADLFSKVDRDVFAKLSTYDEEIPLRSKRALPVPKDAYREAAPMIGQGANVTIRKEDYAIELVIRPQVDFAIHHIEIDRPSDWVVNTIRIGNRHQFAQAGDVPGESFVKDVTLEFDKITVGMDVMFRVTYVGNNPEGAHFTGKLIGKARGFAPKK